MYLWLEVPDGETSEGCAARLLGQRSASSRLGSFFGPSGEGYCPLALVPTEEECARAAAILAEVL